jgi:hypothetical protein
VGWVDGPRKKYRDVQVVPKNSCAENTHSEKVTAQTGVTAKESGDSLVAVFLHVVSISSWHGE